MRSSVVRLSVRPLVAGASLLHRPRPSSIRLPLLALSACWCLPLSAEEPPVALDFPPKSISEVTSQDHFLSLAWNGDQYMAAWSHYGNSGDADLIINRLNASADPVDGTGSVVLSGPQAVLSPRIEALGSGFLVVYSELSGEDNRLYAAQIDAAGQVMEGSPYALTSPAGDAYRGSAGLAAGQDGFVVTWYQLDNGERASLMVQRLDAAGQPVNGSPLAIPVTGYDLLGMSCAWNGSVYLLAWQDDNGLAAARMLPNGNLVDSTPMRLGEEGALTSDLRVASNGEEFLAAWTRFDSDAAVNTIETQAIQGGSVGGVEQISAGTSGVSNPFLGVLAWDGQHYVAGWSEQERTSDGRTAVTAQAIELDSVGAPVSLQSTLTTLPEGTNATLEALVLGDGELLLGVTEEDLEEHIDRRQLVTRVSTVDVADNDGDGVVDTLDVCPDAYDPGQEDADRDGFGDACDCAEDDPEMPDATGVCSSGCSLDAVAPRTGAPRGAGLLSLAVAGLLSMRMRRPRA